MRRRLEPVLDNDLLFERAGADWLPPELRTMRRQGESDELGLRRLAEFPEAVLRFRPRRLSARGPHWPDAA